MKPISFFLSSFSFIQSSETGLVSWLKWWPVLNILFIFVLLAPSLLLFDSILRMNLFSSSSSSLFHFILFKLNQFHVFFILFVVSFHLTEEEAKRKKSVSPFRFGGGFLFIHFFFFCVINFHGTYISNMSNSYGPMVVGGNGKNVFISLCWTDSHINDADQARKHTGDALCDVLF